ncbi:MAG: ComEC/Rec2 family competence protein [Clostridiales bacterium]|nr:ComEC/Rec2 family competence protein [Clostridiales bacterium]
MTLLGFLLKKIRVRGFLNFLICFVFLGVYVYLCGFTPSVLRAGVMGLVLLATKLSGKCYDGLNSLGLSGIVILLISPLFALDVGFQMSFFCVLGIYVISPWLTKGLKKFLPKKIAEAISISIATQLATLPFVANIFSNLNFLSFFVNLIVIPLFSFLYPFLFISVLLTLAMPFMSFLLNVCNWGFELISLVTGFFAETHLQLNLKPLNIFVTTLFFVGFFLLSRFFMVKKKAKVVCSCSVFGIMTVILIALNFIPAQPSLLYCSNYGDSTLLLTNRQNKTLMVDYSYNFERMKVSAGIKYIDNFLFLETSTDSAIDGLEAENVFLLEEGYLDNETVLKENQQVSVDGFNFVYVFVEEKLLGVEINFDQTSVFVFKNSKHSQENVNFVVGQNYDFVLLGQREEYAENFFNSSSIVLTFNKSPCVSKNYQQDGNMFYEIDGNDYKWRVID